MNFFQKLFGKKPQQSESDAKRQEAQEDRKAFSEANYAIGQQLLNAKQYERAFQTFKLIAENDDHQDAQFNLAIMYHRGMGTEKNIHEAVRWYEKVAKHNDNQAMYNLGLIYNQGEDDIPKDNEKAFFWMQKSFACGNEKARAFLHELAVSAFEYIANDLNLAPDKAEKEPVYLIFIPTSDDILGKNLLGAMRFEGEAIFQCVMPFNFTDEIINQFKPLLLQVNEITQVAKLKFNDKNKLLSEATINLDKIIKEADGMHDFYSKLHNFTDIAIRETCHFFDILNP